MLVERGLKVTNVEVVGDANRIRDADAVGSNDLRFATEFI
jgi:hypothetical protein